MRILCVGGAGRICREAILDLAQSDLFERITVADRDRQAADEVARWIDDPRIDARELDVRDRTATVAVMRRYDIVMDGLPISLNDPCAASIAEASVHAINLNGMSHEWDFDAAIKRQRRTFVPGFGMTPGITNLMAMLAAEQLDKVDSVRCSHGAFRPIAFSEAIAETTRVEYDPELPTRMVFEDGELRQVPPFARPRIIELPAPYPALPQYIIPHPEPLTLSKSLAHKGVRLVEARGTWPEKNMHLIRALFDWGMLANPAVRVGNVEVGILDAIFAHCLRTPIGRETELYGYALHVEVIGQCHGQPMRHVLTHTHPPSDGSVESWAGLRAYTRCVGIPLSIGAQLIARGEAGGFGTLAPERAFVPREVFDQLRQREIIIHHEAAPITEESCP